MHALGVLFFLIGVIVLIATIFALVPAATGGLEIRPGIWAVVDVVAYALSIVLMLSVGYGLTRLHRWARVAAIVICSVFLLRLLDGAIIFPYFLYLLLSAKGKRVFAADYGAIIAATPHIRYPKSTVIWTVLAVLAIFVASIPLKIAIHGAAR